MSGNSGSMNTTLITFIVVVFVVVRFLYRELKARVVQGRTLWVRPVFLVVVLALLTAAALSVPHAQPVVIVAAFVAGAVLGVVTGALVLRYTTFEAAGVPGAVRALGSTKSLVVWVVALALRFAFRLFFAHGDEQVQFTLNVFTVALVAVAFIVVALGFHRAIARFTGSAGIVPAQPRATTKLDDG